MQGTWKALTLIALFCAMPSLAEDKNGVSPSRLKLPKGPGSLEGVGENIEPNLSMGLMTYGVPIDVPKGYEGVTPSLRLSYSSGSGSGEVGIGWSISLPSIERMTSRGLPLYTPSDVFAAGGSDELVRVGANVFRARFEGGFVRYTWFDSAGDGKRGYWKAEFPDGRVGYFGAYANGTLEPRARVEPLSSQLVTFRYHLVEMVDVFGHSAIYEYEKPAGETWPRLSRVSYVFEGSTPRYTVDLSWEARADELSDCKPGFDLRLAHRLSGVRVRVRGTQLRRYQLTYSSPTNSGGLSRLERIQQFGMNDLDGPYPIDFSFAYSDAVATTNCSGGAQCNTPRVVTMRNPIQNPIGGGFLSTPTTADLIDINGDGLPDVFDTAGGSHQFWLNDPTSNGFSPASTASPRGFQLAQTTVQTLDLDGDGLTDLVDLAPQGKWLQNLGTGDWQQESALPITPPSLSSNQRFFDFNQDKRIDIIQVSASSTVVFENTPSGFVERTSVTQLDADGLQFADMNGDGMLDAVHILPGGVVRCNLNFGWGRFGPTFELMGLSPSLGPSEVLLVDVNGDGLSDAVTVLASSVSYSLNQNGRGFAAPVTRDASSSLSFPDRTNHAIRFADMNGNGSTDVVWFSSSGQATYLDLNPVRPNLMVRVTTGIGKVIQVTYGSSIDHMLRDGGPSSWAYRLPTPMLTVDRIESWEGTAPQQRHIRDFHYSNGYFDGTERQFRGFRNVEVRTSAGDGVEPGETKYVFDVGQPSSPVASSDPYRKGLIVSQSTWSGGRELTSTQTTYVDCSLAGIPAPSSLSQPIRFVCPQQAETTHKEGLPSARWVTTREAWEHDGFGNKRKTTKSGVVPRGGAGCPPCQFGPDVFGQPCGPQCLGDEYTEESEFVPPAASGPWILRKPRRTISYGQSGGPETETLTFYDGTPFEGLPSGLTRGLVSLVKVRKNATEFIAQQRLRYGLHGEVLESRDPWQPTSASGPFHRRLFTYDAAGLLLTDEEVVFDDPGKVPYSLKMHADYHPILELVSRSSSWERFENGSPVAPARTALRSTTYGYDGFGRLVAVVKPGDTSDYPTETYSYQLQSPTSRIIRKARSLVRGPMDLETVQCFDGKGRKLQTLTRIDALQVQADGWKTFNALDKEANVSQPFRVSTSMCTTPPVGTRTLTAEFDATGRPIKTTHDDARPDLQKAPSFSETKYEPLIEAQFDEEDTDPNSPHASTPTTVVVDGLGRKVRVDRYLSKGAPVVPLHLTYDSLGRLSGYINRSGSVVVRKIQTYDLLGRVEKVNDPDSGETLFTYDDAGNETHRRDARGITLRKAWDEANRLIAEWDEQDPTSRLDYVYDRGDIGCSGCTNVEGQLAKVSYTLDAAEGTTPEERTGTDLFGYTSRGLTAFQQRTLEGHTFVLGTDYDNADRISTRRYPGNAQVSFRLDGANRLVGVPDWVDSVGYDARGLLESVSFPSGVKTTRRYDARMRLEGLGAIEQRGTALQDESVEYDRVGNVVGAWLKGPRESLAMAQSVFNYDDGFRLVSAQVTRPGASTEVLSYGYDDLDNITSKTSSLGAASGEHVGIYIYGENGAGPHAVTSAGMVNLGYNPAGFVKSRGGLDMVWDFRGNLSATRGSENTRYSTGPGFMRVTKKEGGHVTHYLAPDLEVRDGVGTVFIEIGGQRVARFEVAGTAAAYFGDFAPATLDGREVLVLPDKRVTAGDVFVAAAIGADIYVAPLKTTELEAMLLASCRRALEVVGTNSQWWLNDNRGTAIAIMDRLGKLTWAPGRFPYGDSWAQGAVADYVFEGKEEDSTGLLYFDSRYYDGRLGRWLSPDRKFEQIVESALAAEPSALTKTNGLRTQLFRRYVAFSGNPTSRSDPDGQEDVEVFKKGPNPFAETADFRERVGSLTPDSKIEVGKQEIKAALVVVGTGAAIGAGIAFFVASAPVTLGALAVGAAWGAAGGALLGRNLAINGARDMANGKLEKEKPRLSLDPLLSESP